MDVTTIREEMEQARLTFGRLAEGAPADSLRRRSQGTRWTNRQLLFHMVFGYLVVRSLLPIVRGFGRLPPRHSRRFAAALHAARRPFHLINYLGSVAGGQILTPRAMVALLNWTIGALQRSLQKEDATGLARVMHFPASWDPYFQDTMSVLDVYHFGTQHFGHHQHQLTL